mgnify:CR=1 FL=1
MSETIPRCACGRPLPTSRKSAGAARACTACAVKAARERQRKYMAERRRRARAEKGAANG